MLVHGLWSGPQTWDAEFWREDSLPAHISTGSPQRQLPAGLRTRLYKVDYSQSTDAGLDDFWHLVPNMVNSALNEYRSANDANGHLPERGFHGIRYAATRADVIGHSMGGQLARTYVSTVDWNFYGTLNRTRGGVQTAWEPALFLRTGAFGNRHYLRPDNWGAGDIRRFVPIGSPFRGSSLANRIEPYLEPTDQNFLLHQALEDIGALPSFLWPNGVAGAYYEQPTCVPDLSEGSMVQGRLAGWWEYPEGRRAVQMRPLVGIAVHSASGAVFAGTPFGLFFQFALEAGASPALPEPIGASGSDLIVHKYSQGNESDEAGYTRPRGPIEFTGHVHLDIGAGFTAETQSVEMSQEIGRLLSTPVSVINGGVLSE